MDQATREELSTLRAEVAMLARTVRTQGMAIEGLMDSIERYADASTVSMRHMIVALHSASELARSRGTRAG